MKIRTLMLYALVHAYTHTSQPPAVAKTMVTPSGIIRANIAQLENMKDKRQRAWDEDNEICLNIGVTSSMLVPTIIGMGFDQCNMTQPVFESYSIGGVTCGLASVFMFTLCCQADTSDIDAKIKELEQELLISEQKEKIE